MPEDFATACANDTIIIISSVFCHFNSVEESILHVAGSHHLILAEA